MPRILIAGASGGIGSASARAFARKGYEVFAGCHTPIAVQKIEEIGNPKIVPVTLDVETPDPERIPDNLSIVLNCAGLAPLPDLEALETAHQNPTWWFQHLATTAMGAVFLANAAREKMLWGSLYVSLTSDLALTNQSRHEGLHGGLYAYRAGRAALNACLLALGHDLHPYGINVIALSPGWVRTRMGGPFAPIHADDAGVRICQTLMNHLAFTPEECTTLIDINGDPLDW
ncbi:SDR family oxidoreductase [Candidatus Poriferisocius sp.]|uniref:SDR family oxidoreductase n=1 Tax=Candidatus Poriferisocius sp. TaxID=3101276 RepID=UPI003B02B3F6